MKLQVSIQATLLSLFIGLVASQEARAASFSFTRIADTNGPFSSFDNTASINNGGTVAFQANLDARGSGIFTGNGITTTTIADTNSTFTGFGESSIFGNTYNINDAGTVAFVADQAVQNQTFSGVFTGNGTTTNTIITTPTSGPNGESIGRTNSFYSVNINNAGTVDFGENVASRVQVFYTSDGTTLNQIFATQSTLFETTFNKVGTLAYIYERNQVRTSNPTTTTTIADSRSDGGFISGLSINNQGTAAFTIRNEGQVLFTSDGTTRTAIADTSGPFSSFGATAINDANTVAFLGTLDTGETGIFAGTNPLTDRVIATGDSLFGSTVTNLAFNNQELNNSGSVAFFAQLADGTQGIFRADLVSSQPTSTVPEPASTLGLIAFGAIGATRVLKRTQKKRIKLAS